MNDAQINCLNDIYISCRHIETGINTIMVALCWILIIVILILTRMK